jgi:hypothetical protein
MKIRAGKTNRIPSPFSEDLWKVIRYMLQVEVCSWDVRRVPGCNFASDTVVLFFRIRSISNTHAPQSRMCSHSPPFSIATSNKSLSQSEYSALIQQMCLYTACPGHRQLLSPFLSPTHHCNVSASPLAI